MRIASADKNAIDVWTTASGLEYSLRMPLGPEAHDPRTPNCQHCSERGYLMRSMTMALRRAPMYSDMSDRAFDTYVRELEDRLDGYAGHRQLLRAVAVDPYDPWVVMGFVIGDPVGRVLTYLHVKGGYRNMGLAESLAGLLNITRHTPYAVEFPTWDIVRERPGRSLPIGLMNGTSWEPIVVPWAPETDDSNDT